jgi:hypothetical protein
VKVEIEKELVALELPQHLRRHRDRRRHFRGDDDVGDAAGGKRQRTVVCGADDFAVVSNGNNGVFDVDGQTIWIPHRHRHLRVVAHARVLCVYVCT